MGRSEVILLLAYPVLVLRTDSIMPASSSSSASSSKSSSSSAALRGLPLPNPKIFFAFPHRPPADRMIDQLMAQTTFTVTCKFR